MSLLVFGLMRVIPGDPAVVVLGYKATPESIRAMRETFHLDEPLPTQYARWLGGLLRGDFGIDFRQNEPIGRMIVERLPVTIELTVLAALAAALVGVPLGLLAGARRGGTADRASLALGLLGISLPDFWLGIMLILVLSLAAGIMPSSGGVPCGGARTAHARRGARRRASAVRAVRARQGAQRSRDSAAPRAPERRDSDRDGDRAPGRLHARWRDRRRNHFHVTRARADDPRRGARAQLPGRAE